MSDGPRPIFIDAWEASCCLGNAATGWQAVRSNLGEQQAATEQQPGPTGAEQLQVLTNAAQPVEALGVPWLAVSRSKGNTRALFGGPDHLAPSWATVDWPGDCAPLFAERWQLPWWHGGGAVAACATGLINVITCAEAIQQGRVQHGLAAVMDDSDQPVLRSGFESLGVLRRADGQSGFHLSAGGAIVRLRADAGPWRLAGWSAVGDASHPTACHDISAGAYLLQQLWQRLPQPEVIIIHGTGTVAGDAFEAQALAQGPWRDIPQIACKPSLGHCLGSSGLVELALGLAGDARSFWKIAFGFGGHLAGVALERSDSNTL